MLTFTAGLFCFNILIVGLSTYLDSKWPKFMVKIPLIFFQFLYLFNYFFLRTNIMPYFTSFASKRLIAFSSALLISSILSRQFLRGKVSIRNICLITTSYYVVCTNSLMYLQQSKRRYRCLKLPFLAYSFSSSLKSL